MGEATIESVAVPKNVVTVAIPACNSCGGAKLQWSTEKKSSQEETVEDGTTEVTENQLVEQKDADNVKSGQFCWRQFNAVVPGLVLLFSFGVQQGHALNLYANIIQLIRYPYDSSALRQVIYFYIILSYYVGAVVGNLLAGFIARTFRKKTIYSLCGFVQATAGVLLLFRRHDEVGIPIISGLVAGIAYGIAYVTVSIHASDAICSSTRKTISKSITATLVVSVVYGVILKDAATFSVEFPVLGLHLIALAVIAIITAVILTRESVPHYLINKDEDKALQTLTELCGEQEASKNTIGVFDELKSITEEDKLNGINILGGGNFRPLFTIILAKSLNVFWSFVFLNEEQFDSMRNLFSFYGGLSVSAMPFTKLIVGAIVVYLSKWCGRHRLIYGICVFLVYFKFGFSVSYLVSYHTTHLHGAVLTYVWLLGEIAIPFGLDYYQQRLTTEAFTTTKRKWSISVASIYENILYICLASVYVLDIRYFLNSWCVLLILMFTTVITMFVIPKTENLSLRDIRNQFNKTFLKSSNQADKV